MDLSAELKVAEQLARQAGALVLTMQSTATVSHKPGDEGPVTDADIAADQIICSGLRAAFPHDTIISEESYTDGVSLPQSGRVWFVDPIDGTKDYVAKGSDYVVMIGLAIDGIATLGVVYQPAADALWRSTPGRAEAVIRNKAHSINLSAHVLGSDGPIATLSRHHHTGFVQTLLESLGVAKQVTFGSMGLRLCKIAQGEADFYISGSRHVKLWDTCGPSAILTAAGGLATSLEGTPLNYASAISHGHPLVFANKASWNAIKTPLAHAVAKYQLKK